MTEVSSDNHVAKAYNAWGSSYDRMMEEAPFLVNASLLYDRLLVEIVRGRRFKRLLEVGCGSGLQTVRLADHADEVVAIDIADELIAVARKRCGGKDNVRFETADARRLPFDDGSFDCVISYGDVLSHIVDGYDQAVSEISRVSGPGAVLSMEADTKWNLGLLYHPVELWTAMTTPGRGHDTRVWEGMRFKTFTYRELTALFNKHHLGLLSCHGHNILASLLPDIWLLERGRRTWGGKLGLALGRVDLRLSKTFPFNRFGFNFIMTLQKVPLTSPKT